LTGRRTPDILARISLYQARRCVNLMKRIPLRQVVERLQKVYGRPKLPLADPWLLVLWENVAYLADDQRRQQAFGLLLHEIGTEPNKILTASDEALQRVGKHGIVPKQTVEKLRTCARIARDEFEGDLRPILKMPTREAKKALMKFPGIGEPSAEKILLFCRSHRLFGLESNALRVLLRLGYGQDHKNYATTYRLVQAAAAPELEADFIWRIRAYQLLRQHGQETCRRTRPSCQECPLAPHCPDYQARLLGVSG
jgi:endonuclease III